MSQPTRQPGMEAAVVEQQQEEVQVDEDVVPEGAEGEVQKEAVEVEEAPTGEKVTGEQVTGEQDPVDPTANPTPGTSTAPTSSASTGTLSVVAYMSRCQDFAKVWFDEVVQKKEVAYRDLIARLVSLVEEQSKEKDLQLGLADFGEQQILSVLESITDTSGKYMAQISHFQIEVSKEEEEITKKRLTEKKTSAVQVALDDYYDCAKDLCQAQAAYMVSLEKLSKTLDNPDRLLSIINHVQLPAVQVTVTTREQERKQAGVTGEEMVIMEHLPEAARWKLGRKPNVKMMAAWLYFLLYKQVTGSTAGQDKCAGEFGCSVTQFKRMVTGKWQEGGKPKRDTTGTVRVTRKRTAERLAKLKEEEGKSAKKKKKTPKVVHIGDEDDDDDDEDKE